jgi:hypothetical protein
MSSPEPNEDLRLDHYTASRGVGCLAVAGLAVMSLFLSVLGICVQPSPILWLTGLLGDDGGAFIAAVLIGAAVIFFAIYGLIRMAMAKRK